MIIGLIVGLIVFQYLFEQLNKKDLSFINKVHEVTRKIKYKRVLQYTLMIALAAVLWGLMDLLGLHYMFQGATVGCLWALIRFIFEDTMYDSARNTLR